MHIESLRTSIPEQPEVNPEQSLYDYTFKLDGSRAAARVARLVGKNKRVLELGCGPGSQSRVLRDELGCHVVGIEIDEARAATAREFCATVLVADLDSADLRHLLHGEKFDVVTCADVLEHLRNPNRILRDVRGLLTDDGFVVASIPNITHASIVYEMAHGRFEYQAEGLLDATHLRFFSRASAAALFEDSGYRITEFQRVHRSAENTEFKTTPIGDRDISLLSHIRSLNPDAETLQFIIKALPLPAQNMNYGVSLALEEDLRRLRESLTSYENETRRLRSIILWHELPLITRLLRKFGLAGAGRL